MVSWSAEPQGKSLGKRHPPAIRRDNAQLRAIRSSIVAQRQTRGSGSATDDAKISNAASCRDARRHGYPAIPRLCPTAHERMER